MLDKTNDDPMEWEFVRRGREDRGLLFHTLGVEYLGGIPFTRFLRLNKIHQIRYSRKDGETEFSATAKDFQTKFPYFSGNLTVQVEKAETGGIFALNARFNLNYERIQPLKSVLRLPDFQAVLTQMVREAVIAITSAHDPEDFISGGKAKDRQQDLVRAVEGLGDLIKRELGIRVTKVTLDSIDPDEETRKILELKEKTKRENEALVAIAEAKAKAQIAKNEADAHRVREVILPQANAPGAAAIRFAEAYENNDSVTVFAPGGNLAQIIPDVSKGSEKKKAGFKTEPEEGDKK